MNIKKTPKSVDLNMLTRQPKEKIHWALKLLESKGHKLGSSLQATDGSAVYEIDNTKLSIQLVYKLAAKYPEWNDRLGLGTAKIPRVASRK